MQLEDLDINSSLEGFQNVFTAGEFTEQVLDFRKHGVNRTHFSRTGIAMGTSLPCVRVR